MLFNAFDLIRDNFKDDLILKIKVYNCLVQ